MAISWTGLSTANFSAAFGVSEDVTYKGATSLTVKGIVTGVQEQSDVTPWGLAPIADFYVIVKIADFVTAPVQDVSITVRGKDYRIRKVTNNLLAGTYKFDCVGDTE